MNSNVLLDERSARLMHKEGIVERFLGAFLQRNDGSL
jgi:hypothetical protein